MRTRKYLSFIIILVTLTIYSAKALSSENILVKVLHNDMDSSNVLSSEFSSQGDGNLVGTVMNVASPTATFIFERIANGTSIVSGKRYMIVANTDGKYYAACLKSSLISNGSNTLRSVEVSVNDGQLSTSNPDLIFTFEGNDNKGFTIKQSDGSYLTNVKDETIIKWSRSVTNGFWKVKAIDDYTEIRNTNVDNRCMIFNTNNKGDKYDKAFLAYMYSPAARKLVTLYEEVYSYVNVHVSSVGYATLYYSDIALKVPPGVTAKTFAYDDKTNTLTTSKTYDEGETIPKNVAVVLKALEGDYTFTASDEEGEAPSSSNLYGYDKEATTSVEGMSKYYMLSLNANNDANSVGFYWGNDDGSGFNTGAHKAFLALPESAAAKGYAFEDIVDGISSVSKADDSSDASVFSLMGIRMTGKLPAGIYVRKGKKFIVR